MFPIQINDFRDLVIIILINIIIILIISLIAYSKGVNTFKKHIDNFSNLKKE